MAKNNTKETKEDILKKILANKKILARIKKLKLSEKEISENLPILIDMYNQKKNNENFFTSFIRVNNGEIKRVQVVPKEDNVLFYENNIVTKSIEDMNLTNLDDIKKNETRKKLLALFLKYVKNPEQQEKGLYIYGNFGTGKTYLCKVFLKLLAEKGLKCGMITTSNLIQKFKSSFAHEKNSNVNEIMEILKTVPILIMDDIGAETITSWFRDGFLFPILDYRLINNKLTFFTSNYSFEQQEKVQARESTSRYIDIYKGKKIVSRIKLLAEPFYLK